MKKLLFLLLLMAVVNSSAVQLSTQGIGDVQLIPYYTVNNDLNSLVAVTNTKNIPKAMKVNVREGLNGHAVLSYNVYLDAYDTWTFVLVSATSTIPGHEGQASAYQLSTDSSCAPFLNKQRQEFLPFELLDGPGDLSRTREGFIEIIEMGELTGEMADFVDIQYFVNGEYLGTPKNCGGLEAAWQADGIWDESSGGNLNNNLGPITGGLVAEAQIINVSEGITFPIPVVALADFFADNTIAHTNPADTSLSLDSAETKATVMTEGKTYQLTFESGEDAVSAVLMAEKLIGTYAVDAVVSGKSEALFIQPTRRFYVGEHGNNPQPPYIATNSGSIWCPTHQDNDELSQYGGTPVIATTRSRDALPVIVNDLSNVNPRPPRAVPAICDSVSVWQFLKDPRGEFNTSITESNNIFMVNSFVGHNGFIEIELPDINPLVGIDRNSNQPIRLTGIPIIGITLQQFTNAGAAAGLLAQYGGSQLMKSTIRVIEQN